ncbi:MAG: hypothetical protein ABI045_05035 [Flavobacteriales bacterium]
MIPGVTSKITFNSGALSGYEFEIHAYHTEREEFDVVGYEDERRIQQLDEHFKIKVGDSYVIHDVLIPESYVKRKKILSKKAQEYLSRCS